MRMNSYVPRLLRTRTVRYSPKPVTPKPKPVTPKPVTPKPVTPKPEPVKKKRPSIKKPPTPSRVRMNKNFQKMRQNLKTNKLRTARQRVVVNTTVANLFKALENAPSGAAARRVFLKGSLKLHPNKGGNENTYKRFKNIYERKA
jgi:outer membrane biosynthesis protein TonB